MGKQLDRAQIRGIAELARLRPSEADEHLILAHLLKILDYVSKLEELDTRETSSCPSLLKPARPSRTDSIGDSLPPGAPARPAPDKEGNYFRVPRVIE